MPKEFRLPELGENITSGTVTRVMAAVGDTVAAGQPVVELETGKAVVEVPADAAGTVLEVRVQEGQEVQVGAVVLVLEEAVAAAPEAPPSAAKASAPRRAAAKAKAVPPAPSPSAPPAGPAPETPPAPAIPPAAGAMPPPAAGPVLAAPSVRRLARELGVDIRAVPPGGAGGRVTEDDVRRYAAGQVAATPAASGAAFQEPGTAPTAAATAGITDADRWGPVERQPMSSVRRATARHIALAWQTIPHVTHFDNVDATALEAFRKEHGPRVEAAGGKLTVTVMLLKALGFALRKFPRFNASVDMEHEQIVYKKYVHIGVAVDTPEGLLVPVVRDVDRKSITELAVEVAGLAEKARARKLGLDEMQGGVFTLTNLGGIGGTQFTPIINAPEAAILGVSRARIEPVFQDGAFVPRTVLPLSLSYDHRIIDGADAARFLRWLADGLERPFALLL